MSIYTKTGDKGKTSTFAGKRISKSSKLISAIGAIDELNSYLGIIGGLEKTQANLFTMNALLSGFELKGAENSVSLEFLKHTKSLEKEIDNMEGELPVQQNFIIYGGSDRSAQLFYARAICRRAERMLVSCSLHSRVDSSLLIYINRLSDYLFILARYDSFKKGVEIKDWKRS